MTCEVELQPDEVLVASASRRRSDHVYHTSDCRVVGRADGMVVWSRDHLNDRWRECRYCAGEHDPGDCGRREATRPLCGEAVSHPAPHIRAEHGTGGGE